MITLLLLFLSLTSVEGVTIKHRNFEIMVNETLNKEIIDALPDGCFCAETSNNQTLLKLKRCCRVQKCCYSLIFNLICRGYSQRYSYTYSNGTITCDHNVYMTDCAKRTCECDRETVMCLMDQEYPKYKRSKSCYGNLQTCRAIDEKISTYKKKKKNPQ
ncbi:phospholipase A2 homolog ECO_00035-like isoform 1-T2 [Anomaloglossus baeobatrachus]|uniref:phospholipase A2 homolog ECO_00035-like n=1 Tax=Anomaloglossus baeobatrachus TaxID=238106 RepID=UPI003F4F7DE4